MATSPTDVAHVLRRAGFVATPARIAELAPLDRPALVEAVLDTTDAPPAVAPPALVDPALSEYQKWVATTQWWLDRMATAPAPVVEKMTLFWHGHFVSGQGKVFHMPSMYAQNALYRSKALGDFQSLTQTMALQPAMLDYLDNARNRVGGPNQNFARELMELFTLGVGTYSEPDVDASSAAWTGYGLDYDTWTYVYRPSWHDGGQKTFMGVTRAWTGPEIIDHLLTDATTRPIAGRFIARKVWTYLAHPNPSPTLVNELGAGFASDLNVKNLLRAVFLRPEFWTDAARLGLVRSPIEWVVAVMRATGLNAATANPQWWLGAMGQSPFDPPNVSGWRSNGYWISSSAAAAKAAFARYVTWRAMDAGVLADVSSLTPAAAVQAAFDLCQLDRATAHTRSTLEAFVAAQRSVPGQSWAVRPNLLTLVLLTPEMQLA